MSSSMEQGNLSNNDPNSVYYGTPPNEYPLFQNYQLIGDSQLVRFSEVFLSCKRVFFPGSSGRVGYCVSGQRAAQLATHLSAKLWPVYKNVILMIGTNDILSNTDHTEWKASIESILDLFVKYSVRNVIVCTVPPVPKLWHTVQHWTLLVEYNEILKSLEPKHKGSFSSFKLLDITHFFLSKDAFESFYCNRSDLYVISPIVEGMDTYDETFMMTNVRKQWSNSLNNVTVVGQDEEAGVTNDRSYLKQNISLFDIVNIRYKLLNCFNGSTNDQDDAINKDRFDLIGVTPTDVRHIKSNMLQIGNVEYMYTLRHAFQKFLSHLNRDRIIKMKRMSTSDGLTLMLGNTNEEAFVPLKMARPNYDRPSNEEEEDLESSGVYCRRLDTTTVAPQPSRTPYSNIWGAGRNKEGPDNDTQTTPLTSRHQLKRQHPSGTSDVTCLWAKQEIKRTPTGVESDVRDNKEVVYDELTQGISVKVTNEKDNKTGTGNVKNETSKLSMNLVPRPVMLNQSNENLSDKTQTAMKRHGKFLPRVSESEAAAKTTEGKNNTTTAIPEPNFIPASWNKYDQNPANNNYYSSTSSNASECRSNSSIPTSKNTSPTSDSTGTENKSSKNTSSTSDSTDYKNKSPNSTTDSTASSSGRKKRERSFRDVLSLIQNTLKSLKVENKSPTKSEKESPTDCKASKKEENQGNRCPNKYDIDGSIGSPGKSENIPSMKIKNTPSVKDNILRCQHNSKNESIQEFVKNETEISRKKSVGDTRDWLENQLESGVQRSSAVKKLGEKALKNNQADTNFLEKDHKRNNEYEAKPLTRGENELNKRVWDFVSPGVLNNVRRVTVLPTPLTKAFLTNDLTRSDKDINMAVMGSQKLEDYELTKRNFMTNTNENYTADLSPQGVLVTNNRGQTNFIASSSSEISSHGNNRTMTFNSDDGRMNNPLHNSVEIETCPAYRESYLNPNIEQSFSTPNHAQNVCLKSCRNVSVLQQSLVEFNNQELINELPSPVSMHKMSNKDQLFPSSKQELSTYNLLLPRPTHEPLSLDQVETGTTVWNTPLCEENYYKKDNGGDSQRNIATQGVLFGSGHYGIKSYGRGIEKNLITEINEEHHYGKDACKWLTQNDLGAQSDIYGAESDYFGMEPYETCIPNNIIGACENDLVTEKDERLVNLSESYFDSNKYWSEETEISFRSNKQTDQNQFTFKNNKYAFNDNASIYVTIPGLIKNIEDSNTSHNLVANEGKKFKNDSLCIKIVKETPNQTGTDKTPRSAPDRSASQTPNNGNYATLSQDANEETPSLLNIEYLTPEEKREQESRLSKKALCDPDPSHRDRILQGYDRSFLTRSNTIQLYQYIHSVCQYESKYNEDPMDDKIFYAIIQNLRSGSDVENKLYTSMFGRIEFYKFMKYISLSYIMPKMFSNGFKNVMFTSLVNDNCNVQSYVVKNLDTSMFERHFSRLPGTPANKTPRVDLVHLNQKGFELLKTSLTEVIVQIRQETGEDANIRLLKTSLIQTITQ
uniref:OSK domain-containing protein n=1 Tax=Cacopsylla melanoneura TaxID=428564 RepID=A0A8D8S1L1_9HEMI